MEKGWIKLHRSIQENFLRNSEPFTKAQARIDLILLANHKPGTFFVRGIRVDIKRGQLGYSQESLSKRWKWSRGKVIRFLNILENEQQIVQQTGQQTGQQKDKVITVITIVNYDKFQENDTTNGTTDSTTNGQQTDINKNNKNNKNEKKTDFYKSLGFSNAITEWIIEYDRVRKTKLNRLTKKGLNMWKNKLQKLSGGSEAIMQKILEQSIEHGWVGIYELKGDRKGGIDPNDLSDEQLGILRFKARDGKKDAVEYMKKHGLYEKYGEEYLEKCRTLYINNLLYQGR